MHFKSDITHKLNRHEATPADILHRLHDSTANKVVALLEKAQMLSYESDGYAVSPAVLRQGEVHVQQVLGHATASRAARADASKGLAGFIARARGDKNRASTTGQAGAVG